MKVTGAYIAKPKKTSARAEPIPAAKAPYIGVSIQPDRIIKQSPRFTYPPVGRGTINTVVARHIRAADKPENTSFKRFELFLFMDFTV